MALGSSAVVAAARVVLRVDKGDFTSDLASAERQVKQSASEMERATRSVGHGTDVSAAAFKGLRSAVGLASGALIGGAGLTYALKSTVNAALQAQQAQRTMQTQLRALGINYQQHAKTIDTVIQKQMRLSAFDDEELKGSFTGLVRVTHNVNEALRLNGLATDVARGKGISLQAATQLVTKAALGQVGALRRVGIDIKPVTTATDALKASTDHATDAQKAAAKMADNLATRQKAVAQLQRTFAGQAENYGKTSAGAIERFHTSVQNLQETLGAALLPAIGRVMDKLSTWID